MKEVVLIVDHNVQRKNNLSSRLRVQGYNTELAQSGFHAINLIENASFSERKIVLVILTERMHDMSGVEIMGLLRVMAPKEKLPVLMVVNINDPSEVLNCFEHGASDVVVQGANFQRLLKKIQKLAPISDKKSPC
jgi:DNA-binding response OmpR family regulator